MHTQAPTHVFPLSGCCHRGKLRLVEVKQLASVYPALNVQVRTESNGVRALTLSYRVARGPLHAHVYRTLSTFPPPQCPHYPLSSLSCSH